MRRWLVAAVVVMASAGSVRGQYTVVRLEDYQWSRLAEMVNNIEVMRTHTSYLPQIGGYLHTIMLAVEHPGLPNSLATSAYQLRLAFVGDYEGDQGWIGRWDAQDVWWRDTVARAGIFRMSERDIGGMLADLSAIRAATAGTYELLSIANQQLAQVILSTDLLRHIVGHTEMLSTTVQQEVLEWQRYRAELTDLLSPDHGETSYLEEIRDDQRAWWQQWKLQDEWMRENWPGGQNWTTNYVQVPLDARVEPGSGPVEGVWEEPLTGLFDEVGLLPLETPGPSSGGGPPVWEWRLPWSGFSGFIGGLSDQTLRIDFGVVEPIRDLYYPWVTLCVSIMALLMVVEETRRM